MILPVYQHKVANIGQLKECNMGRTEEKFALLEILFLYENTTRGSDSDTEKLLKS